MASCIMPNLTQLRRSIVFKQLKTVIAVLGTCYYLITQKSVGDVAKL